MEKIFNQKSFIYCLDTIVWVVELTYIWIFSFKITSRCKLSDIVPIICHRCHWHQWQIYCWHHWHRWQILPLVSTTAAVLMAKFAANVIDTCGAPWLVNISQNFQKNWKWPSCYFQRLGGRWFMKKTWIKKSCDTVPLMGCFKVPSPYFLFKICFSFTQNFQVWYAGTCLFLSGRSWSLQRICIKKLLLW